VYDFGKSPQEMNSITCKGCKEEQPNQLAHTEPGGCLYEEDDMTYSITDIIPQSTVDLAETIVNTSRPMYYELAPCTVCIFQELQSEYPDSCCRAVRGLTRCSDHILQCVLCKSSVQNDTFLLCTSCWNENKLNKLYRPEKKIQTEENRLCLYTTKQKTIEECLGCGCISCNRRCILLETLHPFTASQ